jgi:sodium transport system permease protein
MKRFARLKLKNANNPPSASAANGAPRRASGIGPWRAFRVVSSKELRELLRDRKTLFWLLAPPFILPAIAILAAVFIGTQTARYITQGFPTTVQNGQAAPGLVAHLRKSKALILVDGDKADTALVRVIVRDGFEADIAAGRTARVTITRRDNTFVNTLAIGAVRSEIATYSDTLFDARLQTAGKTREWLSPVVSDETAAASAATSVTANTAPESGGSGGASGFGAIFLPLAVTSWLIGGGLGLVVDTTVGEKERQTVESILVTPANRLGIVTGKLSVVFLASFVVMGLWMLEGVALSLLGDAGPKILALNNASPGDISAILAQSGGNLGSILLFLAVLLIPFIILLNSVVMIFCSFAGSYRESNVFLFLLQLIIPALVLLSIFAIGPDGGVGWYAVPVLGTIAAIRDLFSQTLTTTGLTISVLSASLYAVGGLALASYMYSREWALTRGI